MGLDLAGAGSAGTMLSSLLRHKYLIRELVSRDIRGRYVGLWESSPAFSGPF